MRRIIVCALALLALSSTPAAAQQSATITGDRVSVRATPSIDASIIATLNRGDVVTVLERRETWTRVSGASKSGWVRTSMLTFGGADKSTPPAQQQPEALPRNTPREAPQPGEAAPARRGTPAASIPDRANGQFTLGDQVIGPVVAIGSLNGATEFGGEAEKAIKELPDLGNGVLGIALEAAYYHYSAAILGSGYSVTAIPIGASANYHFRIADSKIDPFIGAGLGYALITVSYNDAGYTGSAAAGSGLYAYGRGGLRYFFSPKMALHIDAGFGSANLGVGLMFRP